MQTIERKKKKHKKSCKIKGKEEKTKSKIQTF